MLILRYIRVVVLLFSLLLSVVVYLWVAWTVPLSTLQISKLTQIYALLALAYLYLALLASPLTQIFTSLPGRGHYLRARRAIGQSTFYFALLHSTLAFWGQLGGLRGLGFLSNRYLLAISLSFTALVILGLMAATSFNRMVAWLGYRQWKWLHRFVYLAGVLILIHALMLGSHFSHFSRPIPQIFSVALVLLLLLEATRFDRYLQSRRHNEPQFVARFIMAIILLSALLYSLTHSGSLSPFGIHREHAPSKIAP